MMRLVFEKLIQRFYDLPLNQKFILSFFAFTIIPFALLFSVFYSDISDSEMSRAENNAKQAFNQAASYIEFKVKNVNDVINVVALDTQLNNIFMRNLNGYHNVWQDEKEDFDYLRQLSNRIKLQSDLENIVFYFSNPASYTDVNIDLQSMESIRDKELYDILYKNNGRIMWFSNEYFNYEKNLLKRKPLNPNTPFVDNITTVKAVKDSNDLNHFIGFLRFDIPEKEIQDIIVNAATIESQLIYIVDENNAVITSNNRVSRSLPATLAAVAGNSKINSWQKASFDDGDTIIGVSRIEGTDWRVISALPYNDLMLTAKKLKSKVLLFFVLLAISVFSIVIFISNTNTRRLKRFVKLMKSAGKGDFNIQVLPKNKDEIGILVQNFNGMLTRISMLLDEKYRMGQEVKNAELKALQAQINPHFLYNTLDLIHWFAALGKTEELMEVVFSLSRFYKLTLSRGEHIIPLRDEIEHVKAYVDIQNIRFDGFLKLEVDVPEELMECMVPKVTLQPIVENSILHGIMEKDNSRGTVSIKAEIQGENILIRVADDGVGMDEELVRMLEAGKIKTKGSSYGIRNIKERIQLLYGDCSSLSFQSSPGSGTEVKILITARGSYMNHQES